VLALGYAKRFPLAKGLQVKSIDRIQVTRRCRNQQCVCSDTVLQLRSEEEKHSGHTIGVARTPFGSVLMLLAISLV